MAEQTGDRSDQPASNTKPPGWSFLLQWVLASLVGGVVGGVVGEVVVGIVGGVVGLVAYGVVGVVGIGVAQWLVLRERVAQAGWWLVASVGGGVVGGVASAGLILGGFVGAGEVMSNVVAVILGWVLVGGGMGVAQWLVLRRQVARAGWWVLTSVVGVVMGLVVGGVVGLGLDGVVGQVAGHVAYGVVYGEITGFVLVQLLCQRAGDANDAMTGSA